MGRHSTIFCIRLTLYFTDDKQLQTLLQRVHGLSRTIDLKSHLVKGTMEILTSENREPRKVKNIDALNLYS